MKVNYNDNGFMYKILDLLLILSLLLLAGFGGFKAGEYFSAKDNLELKGNVEYGYNPYNTEWDENIITGNWEADTERYKILLFLSKGEYLLVLVNKDDETLRMFSEGNYSIKNQKINLVPDLDIKRPEDKNEKNSYGLMSKKGFHADIAFHKNVMLWSVENVYMSPYMIGDKKYPAHPLFRYVDSPNIRWKKR